MANSIPAFSRIPFLTAIIALLSAISVFAEEVDPLSQLRNRIDSIEVEKQVLKRLGKSIDDLEAITAALRDSLLDMRDTAVLSRGAVSQQTTANKESFSLKKLLPLDILPAELLSFRPSGLLDWVIVGTGVVALLSGALLFFGIILGRGKRRKEKGKAGKSGKPIGRKMNYAPPQTKAGQPIDREQLLKNGFDAYDDNSRLVVKPDQEIYNSNGRVSSSADSSGQGALDNLQSLMEQLRKISPPPTDVPKQVESAPKPLSPPPPPPPPPPLFAEAPNAPPPFVGAKPASMSAPDFNVLVVTAANGGMSDLEISKRYQVSVDQVRLILRMANK